MGFSGLMREGGCKNKSEVKVKGARYYPRKQTPKDPMQRHTDCCASLSKKSLSRWMDSDTIKKKKSDTKKEKKTKPHHEPHKKTLPF